jgi:hypothetical protein
MVSAALASGVEQLWNDGDHPLLSSAKVKNELSYTSIDTYMVCTGTIDLHLS